MLRGCSQRGRCIRLVILLEFLFFSAGSAMPTREDYRDQIQVSGNLIAPSPPLISNSPALQEVSRRKDPSSGLYLVRKFIAAFISEAQFDWAEKNSPDHIGSGKRDSTFWSNEVDSKFEDLGRNRRLLNGARHPGPGMWAANEQQQYNELERRNAMESSSSPAEQSQQFLLSPPAPSSLVHNEKQDWNQDYAEPDVHPPSSN